MEGERWETGTLGDTGTYIADLAYFLTLIWSNNNNPALFVQVHVHVCSYIHVYMSSLVQCEPHKGTCMWVS